MLPLCYMQREGEREKEREKKGERKKGSGWGGGGRGLNYSNSLRLQSMWPNLKGHSRGSLKRLEYPKPRYGPSFFS